MTAIIPVVTWLTFLAGKKRNIIPRKKRQIDQAAETTRLYMMDPCFMVQGREAESGGNSFNLRHYFVETFSEKGPPQKQPQVLKRQDQMW